MSISECRFGSNRSSLPEVPISFFLGKVAEKTGWNEEDLLTSKDIGDLEAEIGVRATRPTQTKSTKRGKSKNSLYRFVTKYERDEARRTVDSLLENK